MPIKSLQAEIFPGRCDIKYIATNPDPKKGGEDPNELLKSYKTRITHLCEQIFPSPRQITFHKPPEENLCRYDPQRGFIPLLKEVSQSLTVIFPKDSLNDLRGEALKEACNTVDGKLESFRIALQTHCSENNYQEGPFRMQKALIEVFYSAILQSQDSRSGNEATRDKPFTEPMREWLCSLYQYAVTTDANYSSFEDSELARASEQEAIFALARREGLVPEDDKVHEILSSL